MWYAVSASWCSVSQHGGDLQATARQETHNPAPTPDAWCYPLLLLPLPPPPPPSQIVLDLGRQPEARFLNAQGEFLRQAPVSSRGGVGG